MNKVKNFCMKIWLTPFSHGLLLAGLSAFIGVVYPFLLSWFNSVGTTDVFQVPELKVVLVSALKATVAGVIAYLAKNGMIGSSNTATINDATIVKDIIDVATKK